MGKRAWNSGLTGGMGKRAWNSGFTGVGKRSWYKQRAFNAPNDLAKRAWNSGLTGMGKRAWNSGLTGRPSQLSLVLKSSEALTAEVFDFLCGHWPMETS